MKEVLILALLLIVSCTSNKSVKQEFNDTADQVDSGVRRIIEEAKDTGGKVIKKIKSDD